MRAQLRDVQWIRQAFLLPEHAIDDEYDAIRRVYTTADQKFTDTTLGGNWAINALPQFTRYADIKRPPKYPQGKGMGRFYSEVIDDNAQLVHFRLGVPKFNSLQRFLGDFYSVEASSLARTGRSPSAMFTLGKAAGFVVSLPLQPILLGSKFIRILINKPASRFYYLKPTMPLYWNAVASLVNGIAVNLGVIPRQFTSENASLGGDTPPTTDVDRARYHALLPDIIRPDGGIDIYAVANRAQRLANAFNDALEQEVIKSKNPDDLKRRIREKLRWRPTTEQIGGGDLQKYLDLYLKSADGQYDAVKAGQERGESDQRDLAYIDSMEAFFHAERQMGSEFISFRVDHTGTQAETFSNSTKESGIASTINSTSSSARSTRFNLAEGNFDAAGVTGKITEWVSDFAGGLATSLEISGIAALAGSAFVDIPKTWDSSSADINRTSFTIPLRSPYGHDLARLQNVLVPMCMLIAMAVPLSTGKQSYTSPFILEMFNQGRSQVRLGMVDSLSITRGVGDVGWTRDGKFLGVDVTLSIVDLSSVVHMPIAAAFSLAQAGVTSVGGVVGGAVGQFGKYVQESLGQSGSPTAVADAATAGAALASGLLPSTYDDDNTLTDYLAVLGSLPLEDQINQFRKLKLRMTRQAANWNQWRSPAHLANWGMGTLPGEILQAMSQATDRP